MSLLSALEDERKEVMKIIEQAEAKRNSPKPQSPSVGPSLLINDRPPSAGRSMTPSGRVTPSLILDDGGMGAVRSPRPSYLDSSGPTGPRGSSPSSMYGSGLKPVKSSPASSGAYLRSKSETRHSDPSDPFQTGSSFYYTSQNLRPSISQTSSRESSVSRDKSSRFRFWKSGSSKPANNGRSASSYGSASRGTSRDSASNVDMEKLRLSMNAHHLTSSAPSTSKRPVPNRSQSYTNPSYSSLLNPSTKPSDASPSPQIAVTAPKSDEKEKEAKNEKEANNVYLNLSASELKKVDGALGKLYSSPTSESRRLVDEDESSSSDDDDDADDSSSDDDDDSGDETEVKIVKPKPISLLDPPPKAEPPKVNKVKSLLDDVLPPGAVPPPSMSEYAAYKRRIIHPSTAFDNDVLEDTPYTSDTEELRDARHAAKLPLEISTVHSSLGSKRMIRTMSRGENIPSLTDPNVKRPKTFVLGTDLSPEAAHALEWTVGTVLRDNNVLYVVCANEDGLANGTFDVTPQQQEDERMDAMTELTNMISKLLKRTRLQVHVIIEVIHCKSPKHLLTAVIDYVNPTMVILGSRGRGAIKGVLLGSFSNYVVERSSVPVMVARRKLQKTKHKDLNVRLANNLRPSGGLSMAKVD